MPEERLESLNSDLLLAVVLQRVVFLAIGLNLCLVEVLGKLDANQRPVSISQYLE